MNLLRTNKRLMLWFIPFAVLLFLVCVLPFLWIVLNSFKNESGEWTFSQYTTLFTDAFYSQSISNALKLSIISSLLGLIIALITVNSIYKVPNKLNHWILSFINMSSHFSGVPLAFAFMIIMGANGIVPLLLKSWGIALPFSLYSLNGLLIIYTYFQVPLGILLLYPAFSQIDPEWKRAAQLLGASTWQYIRTVMLPVLLPSLLSTFVMLMANSLGAYATAYALTSGNINLLVIRISSLVAGDIFLNPTLAAALSVILMLQLLVITLFNQVILKHAHRAK